MTEPVGFARLAVGINEENSNALDDVCARDGVAVTEATRRLLTLGYLVYHAIKVEGREVLVHDGRKLHRIKLS